MFDCILQSLSATSGWNAILSVVGAILAAWLSGIYVFRKQMKATERLHASILYYDLKSIEIFFTSTEDTTATILYATDWQKSLAYCTFMHSNSDAIREIYNIYIQIYDFNWRKRNVTQVKRATDQDYKDAKENACPALEQVFPVFEKKYPKLAQSSRSG